MGYGLRMLALLKGRYTARLAVSPADHLAAQVLRYQCFMGHRGGSGRDTDAFDDACLHMLVEEAGSGVLACTYRLLVLPTGADIHRSYAAQFYDLKGFSSIASPVMELGRFCVAPDRAPDADLLRVAWGAMTRIVDAQGITVLFGCASFPGADATRHTAALQVLAARHLGPTALLPRLKHPGAVPYARQRTAYDPRAALAQTPPLLRTYLMMGGWVSDHAVSDPDLDTLHVFTAVEIATIPPARARALRALAV
jgi:L-ornithine Nalpha-acyltransferase